MIQSGFSFRAIRSAFLGAGMALIMVSTAQAEPAGCDPEFQQIQKNHAEAQVAADQAMAKEIIEQPDSVLALSCFDQAMAASAKAGSIFSDEQPTFTPSWNALISTGLGMALDGPFGPGTTKTLASQIGPVVQPSVDDLLSNFTGSLSAAMGDVLSSQYMNLVGPLLNVSGLGGFLNNLLGIDMNCARGQNVLDDFVIGQGINKDVSYESWDDTLRRDVPWGTFGSDALSANQGILDSALEDQENLNTPGYFEFNPVAPVIPQNASMDSIIDAM